MNPPVDPKAEMAVAIAKGAVSAIPMVGGLISEVGNLFFNPLEKRKQQWMSEVAKAISDIERRFSIIPSELEGNERFISFLYQATSLALKSHQREKIAALKAALISSVGPNSLGEDVAFQFLRYIDELTPSHLKLLAWLGLIQRQLSGLTELEKLYSMYVEDRDVAMDRVMFRTFLQDLDARFLLRLGDVEELPEFESKKGYYLSSESALRPIEVTQLGHSFLAFVEFEESTH